MDIDADHRFLQSLKTHLSSATLQDTYLLGRRFLLKEMIGVLLRDILPEALSHAGVGVAGDTFDFRIVDNLVSPRLGKGACHRSFGKLEPLPSHYHAAFAQWHWLSLLKDARTLTELRRLARHAERPEEIRGPDSPDRS